MIMMSSLANPFGRNRRFQLFLLACTVAIGTSAGAAEPDVQWKQWRGPARDGHLQNVTLPERLEGGLQQLWQSEVLAPSYSGPVIAGGLVVTTETVDRKLERVTAFRLADGEPAWEVSWEASLAVPFFAASNGDWIRATPAVEDNALVVSSMRDIVVCLELSTGKERWRVDFAEQLQTKQPAFGNVCSPLIDDGAVYVQAGQAVTKLDLASGKVLWRSLEQGDAEMASSGAFSSPVIATLAGRRQLVVQTREQLAGVTLEDGQVLWQQPIEAFRGMNILTPLVEGDAVFTSSYGGRSQLYRIVADDQTMAPELVWENKVQGYMSSPVFVDGAIYMHLKNQRLTCLDWQTGKTQWTSRPYGKYQSLVSDGKRLLALDESGELLLLAVNPESQELIDRMQVADDAWAHVAVAGPYVVVRDLRRLKVYRQTSTTP